MAAAKSCERSEHSNIECSQIKKPLKKYFSAVTIKLNTAPWKKNGIVNEETVLQMINAIYESMNIEQIVKLYPLKWELDSKCQLHLHTTVETSKPIFRKKTIQYIKDNVKNCSNYSIYIKAVNSAELEYWLAYCAKTNIDVRPLYYRIIVFYHAQPQVIEDFSDLADYDVEYDTKSGHFRYIDSSKVKAWQTNYNYN